MTLKHLLKRWCLLAILATGVVAAHVTLQQHSANIAEKLLAPTYAQVTDEEAYELGAAAYDASVEDATHRQEQWDRCVATTEDYLAKIVCRDRHGNVSAASKSQLISNGHRIHRQEFFYSEVEPRVETVETSVAVIAGIAYAVIGLFALAAFRKWFNYVVLPHIRGGVLRLKEMAPVEPHLKTLNANRKLRKAEKDFLTVKNLYDNGLISEEMFESRKSELKTVLESNQIFRKQDG